jgi:hypothetical protein
VCERKEKEQSPTEAESEFREEVREKGAEARSKTGKGGL